MRRILCSFLIILFCIQPVSAGSPEAGDSAPDFSLTSLDNEKFSLSGLKGKVVLVGLFHICIPCMNQAMEFEKVRNAVKSDDLVILGINTSGDSAQAVQKYLNGFPQPVSFPYLLDPQQTVHAAYNQRDMPTVLIIDSAGVIKARTPAVGADQLIPYLRKLL
ncbi:MAG: redoxin domain-containing protein [Nitrospinaceae bacterium]|nr:TlpA family protein disulfide reductase [Nitrospinaceae bacterium]NIR56707.1 TlpA family protein disulfide reductase [Nitrospinaceae bacterium]NIT84023.1 TlpA family protein disulfide reductase [Nitrospinaceae bacterium]NIX36376.1 redoxin domain-containing protein [Nitrospinaceae bacterium]NIY17438.1 redoxin domain-containing protein [Nitrospinaceae bacterium]